MSSTNFSLETPDYFLATSITHFSGYDSSDPFSADYANKAIKTLENCKTSHVPRNGNLNFNDPNTMKEADRQFVSMTYSKLRSLSTQPSSAKASQNINRQEINFRDLTMGKIFYNSLRRHEGLIPENMHQALKNGSSFSSNYIDSMMLYGRRGREDWAEAPITIKGDSNNVFLLGDNSAHAFSNKSFLTQGRNDDGPFSALEYVRALNKEDPMLQVCSTGNEVFMAIYPYLYGTQIDSTQPSRPAVVKVTLAPKFNPAVTKAFENLRVTLVPVKEENSKTKCKFHILHKNEEDPDAKQSYRIAATTLIVNEKEMPALIKELDIYFKTTPPKTKRSIINTEAVLRTLQSTRHITVLSAVSQAHLETMQQLQTTDEAAAGAGQSAVSAGAGATTAPSTKESKEKTSKPSTASAAAAAGAGQSAVSAGAGATTAPSTKGAASIATLNTLLPETKPIQQQEQRIEQLETDLQNTRTTSELNTQNANQHKQQIEELQAANQQQEQRIGQLETDLQDARRTNRLAKYALTAVTAVNTAAIAGLAYYSATQEEKPSSWF